MIQKSNRQIWRLLGIAVFINALLCTTLMLAIVPSDIWLLNFRTSIFLPSSLFAHFSFLFFILALPVFITYLLGFRSDRWLLFILLVFSALVFIIIIDTRVFALYRFHLNSMALNLLLGGAALEILSFSWRMWMNIFLVAFFVLVSQFIFLKWLFQQNLLSGKTVWPAILTLMISTQLFYGYRDAVADTSIIMQLRYIPWAQPLTLKRKLRKLGIIDKISDTASLTTRKHSAINYPLSPLICDNPEEYNYLILMVDSLRADMMTSEVMPNTAAFSKNAHTYTKHWSTSNSTRFGVFGFFYGIPSSYWFDMLKEQRGSALFDVLLDHDYKFHIDAAKPLNSPEFDRTVFSAIRDQIQWVEKKDQINGEEEDTIVIDRLLAFLDQDHEKKFFAFSFLDAPHGYSLPKGESPFFQPAITAIDYLELDNDYDSTQFLNLYKSAIHYNDRLLGQVYNKLSERDLLKNTVVIITSDHSQEFNDLKLNYWGHNSNFSEHQVQVPLVIHWPGKESQQITRLTSHEDIIPTLLQHGLNCENPVSDYSTGSSLFVENNISEPRNLLLGNWNARAIYTNTAFYNFPAIGNVEILDHQYRMKEDQAVNNDIIRQNMSKMSRYLK